MNPQTKDQEKILSLFHTYERKNWLLAFELSREYWPDLHSAVIWCERNWWKLDDLNRLKWDVLSEEIADLLITNEHHKTFNKRTRGEKWDIYDGYASWLKIEKPKSYRKHFLKN
jgi:hypothetical protein